MVEDRVVHIGGQALPVGAQPLVDPVKVIEHDVGLGQLAQEAQHRQQLFACDPDHGYAGQGGLDADGIGAELGAELGNDPLVIILVGRYVQCLICSHHEYRYRSTVEYGGGAGTKARSHVVGCTQIGDLDALVTLLLALRRHICPIDTLISDDPGQGATLLADGFLQQHQPLQKGFGTGRATGDVHVHGQELVHALNDGINVIHAAGVGAGAHGNDPLGFEHLLVETLDDWSHLDEAGTRDDHEIRLTRRRTNDLRTEAGNVMRRRKGCGHFHVAAGEAEVVWPERIFASPIHRTTDHIFELAHEDVAVNLVFQQLFVDTLPGTDGILVIDGIRIDPNKFILHVKSLILASLASCAGPPVTNQGHRWMLHRQDPQLELK